MLATAIGGINLLLTCGILVLVSLTFCYVLIVALLFAGVSRLKRNRARSAVALPQSEQVPERSKGAADLSFVSILVAARDEERTISDCLQSLVQQQYPSDRYEIVVVNDRSTDNTPTIVEQYQSKFEIIKCVNVNSNSSGLTGKQNAINEGLRICSGEIILNIDADCVAGPLWIYRTVSRFTPQVGISVGFIFAKNSDANGYRSIFTDLQCLDILLLRYAAAGAAGMNVTAPCGGANLAYRKVLVDNIDCSRLRYTFGEDVALIQLIAKDTDWETVFVYDRDAIVWTYAEESMRLFLSQRIRWIIGGRASKSWSQIPLHAMLLFYLHLLIFISLAFFIHSLIVVTLICSLIKVSIDFAACWRVCKELKRPDLLKLFIPYEIFLTFYSIFTGFGSMVVRRIHWKGDIYAKDTLHR